MRERWLVCGDTMTINKEGDTVTSKKNKQPYQRGSAVGEIGIDVSTQQNIIYRWNIKILKFDKARFYMHIGIINTTTQNLNVNDNLRSLRARYTIYGYDDYGLLITPSLRYAVKYGDGFEEGDVIGIEINCKDKKAAFYLNDEDQGAFSIVHDVEYHLAVSFTGKNDCVKILDFTGTYIP